MTFDVEFLWSKENEHLTYENDLQSAVKELQDKGYNYITLILKLPFENTTEEQVYTLLDQTTYNFFALDNVDEDAV